MDQNTEVNLDQLNDEADIAADYLEELLDIVDYEGDIELGIRQGRPVVQIVADDDTDIRHLIGRDGQVVNALQHLTRLVVQQSTGERSRIIVDVDGYLKRKRDKLVAAALDAVQDVLETGEPVDLRPMNSYERLKSRSHGVEPKRFVTVYQKHDTEVETQDDFDDDTDGVEEYND